MTTIQILMAWLLANVNESIAYHDIEQRLPVFGSYYYNKLHNAGTYTRAFRKLKENKNILKFHNIDIIKLNDNKSIADKWKIVKMEY